MDGPPCGVRTGTRESPIGKQFHANISNLGKMFGVFFRVRTRSLVWASLSFFILAMFEHECCCCSQHFMTFLHFSLFRLQPIHDTACCNPLPWVLSTHKPKSLQPQLLAVMRLESSAHLVSGNMWVAEFRDKTLLTWCSSFWTLGCVVWCSPLSSAHEVFLVWSDQPVFRAYVYDWHAGVRSTVMWWEQCFGFQVFR